MSGQSRRLWGSMPNFCRILKPTNGTIPAINNKFYSTALNEEPNQKTKSYNNFRFKYPEFLPMPKVELRNPLREKLERREMLKRRNVINIPEFYVGSVLAVTSSDKHATGKIARFVGICIAKNYNGLNTTFILRNIVDHLGVEIKYHLYSPIIRSIEVLRLEKRLDDELFYLRDAPNEYSTFPFDMTPEYIHDKEVPINTIKVKLNERPWLQRYERMDLKGVILPELPERFMKRAAEVAKPWEKYDLMDEYRRSIPEEEQKDIFKEICDDLLKLETHQKVKGQKKTFVKPTRQKIF